MQILLPWQENDHRHVKCTGKGAKRGEHETLQGRRCKDNASLRRPLYVPCRLTTATPDRLPHPPPNRPSDEPHPYEKARFPDFAIVAQASRAFRYRKLYMVDFTTNEGERDTGRVIYSTQATRRASGSSENGYCNSRGRDYKSCMFSTVDLCWAHRQMSAQPVHSRHDWPNMFGYGSSIRQAEEHRDDGIDGREVNRWCDPRPPGSNRQ